MECRIADICERQSGQRQVEVGVIIGKVSKFDANFSGRVQGHILGKNNLDLVVQQSPERCPPFGSHFVSLVSQLTTYFLTDKRLTFNGLLLRLRTRAGGGVVVGGCLRVSFLMQLIDAVIDRKAIKIQRAFIIRVHFLFAKCSRSSVEKPALNDFIQLKRSSTSDKPVDNEVVLRMVCSWLANLLID